VKLRSRVEL
ncbi:hypothetical protein A2U01_0104746, partial [Trifolium medium]|nr:hypothetical protein [Trifolium medium]MCI83470.1 hypothetical protein [Trifolium medium]